MLGYFETNYLRQVNGVNGGDTVLVRCVCLCVCVRAQRTGQSGQFKAVKATDFKFDMYVSRDSSDMTPKIFSKRGVARFTWPPKFWALNANSSKTVKAADFKTDVYVSSRTNSIVFRKARYCYRGSSVIRLCLFDRTSVCLSVLDVHVPWSYRLAENLQYLWNGPRQDQGNYKRKLQNRFRLIPKSTTLDDLIRRLSTLLHNKVLFGVHHENLNEDGPLLSAAKIAQWL